MPGFEPADVLGPPPPWTTLLRRGLRRRCPRCGERDVFVSRWRLRDRCPGCGYRFRREPGFALGAWFLNFMLLQGLYMVGAMVYIVWASNHPGTGLWTPLLVGAALAVSIPFATYPHSQTTWAAIDLIMTPMELEEIVDALDSVDDDLPDPPGADGSGGSPAPGRRDPGDR